MYASDNEVQKGNQHKYFVYEWMRGVFMFSATLLSPPPIKTNKKNAFMYFFIMLYVSSDTGKRVLSVRLPYMRTTQTVHHKPAPLAVIGMD